MKTNVGSIDRVIRIIADLAILGAGYYFKSWWGLVGLGPSCNPRAHTIRLNTDLAEKPREYLEYFVVHEMVHLLEPTHNARFVALMERFMPKWQYSDRTFAYSRGTVLPHNLT